MFFHITLVPKGSELCGEQLEWFNIWEGHIFRHLPGNKGDEDQKPTKVKPVALILCFLAA
jgi:hypothetical protein